jgi:hypothetical protein
MDRAEGVYFWDAVEFYTQKKVVIERWPEEWS